MNYSACFIGHRKISDTPEFRKKLKETIETLIKNGTINFVFGDHSAFNDICYSEVTEYKKNYPQIKRIKFRTNYENADGYTERFLTDGYEESIFPQGVHGSGRAAYIERNKAMIKECDICVFYYNKNYMPPKRKSCNRAVSYYIPKSGTALAYDFAVHNNKTVINCFK